MHVVATAGHVDHGKSTLVLALTGRDPDRFEEEKRRGLTIDLGFAWTTLPSGRGLSFVDVPGHVRFLKNMLAGVGAVDACLFVVAATEGWKPQSEEHLRILELLGVEHGLLAVTKIGLVDDESLELVRLDLADHVAGTFLEDADVIATDAPTGRGLDELRAGLDRLLDATPTSVDWGRARLWVDRSFAAAGAGTVVTGTLAGGRFRVGDELVLLPSGRTVRVRALQSREQTVDEIGPGNRVAVNVVGVGHEQVGRGNALVPPGRWHTTQTIDASLGVLSAVDHEVGRRGAYLTYLGSGEHPSRLRVIGRTAISPGSDGAVRLHLPVALPLVPGDRYVLRESGRGETIGGGEILDVDPVLPASRARPDRDVDRVIAERGWVDTGLLERLTGQRRAPTVGRWVVDPGVAEIARDELRVRIRDAGGLGLDTAALSDRERATLDQLDEVTVAGGRATIGGVDDPFAGHPFVAAVTAAPFSPPAAGELGVDRTELRELVRRSLLVEQDGIYFAPAAIDEAAHTVAELLVGRPEGVTVAEVRDRLGTSRKYAVPLLNRLDATGVTRRRGDLRVAGPRLPAVS